MGSLQEVHEGRPWPADRASGVPHITTDLRDAAAVHMLCGASTQWFIKRRSWVTDWIWPIFPATREPMIWAPHACWLRCTSWRSIAWYWRVPWWSMARADTSAPSTAWCGARARQAADLDRGEFEPRCPECAQFLSWAPVPEEAPLRPTSVYAATKLAQENLVAAWCRGTGAAVVALRYHNVYGPRMPYDSPYSGVAALFRTRIAAGEPPLVFEDGRQMRDFVHVHDVARANRLALELPRERPPGLYPRQYLLRLPRSVGWAAVTLAERSGGPPPIITGEYRVADVRHVVARPDRARTCWASRRRSPQKRASRRSPRRPSTPRPTLSGRASPRRVDERGRKDRDNRLRGQPAPTRTDDGRGEHQPWGER